MMHRTVWLAVAVSLALPAARAVAQEPGDAPADAPAAAPHHERLLDENPTAPVPTSSEQVLWALGLQGHGVFVPGWLLGSFLDQYSALNSGGFALQGIRRKGTFDIVLTLDFSFYSPPDGNWRGAGKDPSLDTHYTEFHNLNFLSADVTFLYTHDLASWVAIQVGGGVGLGVVFGDVWTINNSPNCSAQNATDTSLCHPVGTANPPEGAKPVYYTDAQGKMQVVGDMVPGTADFRRKLDATTAAQQACIAANGAGAQACKDTALHPYFHKADGVPPVLPVIDFIIGLKFKLHRHLNFNLSGGFRDGFVINGGPEYVF